MSFVLERFTDKPPTTVNDALAMSRKAHARIRRVWRAWAKGEADDRGWLPIVRPVAVDVVHLRPNYSALPDVGALAFITKPLLDGLVDAGVLAGDSPRFVRSLHFHEPEIIGRHGVRLIVRELEIHLPTTLTATLPIGELTRP